MQFLYLVGFFAILLLAAAYLMFANAQQKRREQRQRLTTILKARRNLFKELLTGFPTGFLPKELTTLLLRSLRDTAEQLVQIEPKVDSHKEELKAYSTQLSQIMDAAPHQRVRLTNIEQIQEARKLLQELFRFIGIQEQSHQLTNLDASAHKDQIKRLALQITVDGHMIQAKTALNVGKAKLAIHYYNLALKLLASENSGSAFDKQITQLTQQIAKIQASLAVKPIEEAADSETKDWENFEENSADWKKKNLYDE